MTTHLQSHQKTFTFDVREAEVYTTGIATGVPVADYMLYSSIDFVDQPVREVFDPGMVSLRTGFQYHVSR